MSEKFFKSVNIWQSYKQERDFLVHLCGGECTTKRRKVHGNNHILNYCKITEHMSAKTISKCHYLSNHIRDIIGLQSLGKVPSRLDQIRLEETVAQQDQEAAHERYQ